MAQYDCFISYKSEDRKLAEQVHDRLVAAGFSRIWFDRKRLQPGAVWDKEIEEGCESSRVILPILTPRWSSEWTRFETYGAEAVIPLRFEGAFADVTPGPLLRFQAVEINFTDGASEADWQGLVAALKDLLARPAPDKKSRTARLKYLPNPHFVGRERELLAIHEHFHGNPTTGLTQGKVHAITAMGGVGKTTLARQYAEKFWRNYQQMLWVDARNGIESEFAAIWQSLHPDLVEDLKDREKAERLLHELGGREDRLLIIDNAEDEQSVQHWIPKMGGCRTLITSRFAGWSSGIGTLHMYVLEASAARDLLLSRAGQANPSGDDIEACDELAGKLGYLPLALEQAAAYVRQQRRGFRHYLHVYEQATADLLRKGVLGSTEYPDSVIATWKPTLARLPPESRALLSIASFMSPTPVPIDYIAAGARFLREATRALAAVEGATVSLPESDEFFVGEALGPLADYSMLRMAGGYFAVHPLMQTVLKVDLTPQEFAFWALTAANFYEVIKGTQTANPEHWPQMRAIYQHLLITAHNALKASSALDAQEKSATAAPVRPEMKVDSASLMDRAVWILSQTGNFNAAIGNFETAEQLLRPALEMDARLPPDPRRRVRPVRYLADLLDGTERSAEVEPLLREQLRLYEAAVGPDDPDVASGLIGLAQFLVRQHRWKEAQQLLERADRLLEKETDSRLLDLRFQCFATLIGLYDDTGRHEEAQQLRERAKGLRTSAPDEIDTAGVIGRSLLDESNRLAAEGKLAEAEALVDRFVAQNEAALGSDSDDMSIPLSFAGDYYEWAGCLDKAIEMKRRALAIEERSYGPEHTMTARALEDLAQPLEEDGKHEEALATRNRALAIEDRAYPNGHASIAANLHNIGTLLEKLEQLEPAEATLRRALAVIERIHGAEHLDAADCLVSLIRVLVARGSADLAKPLLDRVRSIHERHLGPGNDQFATILRAHAHALFRAGRSDLVEAVLRERLAILERIHGPEHAEVLLALRDLCNLVVVIVPIASDTEALLHRAIELAARLRGASDAITGDLQATLGLLLAGHGRVDEAEFLLHSAVGSLRKGGSDFQEPLSVALRQLAELHVITGRMSTAEPLLREALAARDPIARPLDHERMFILMRLGQVLAMLERPAEGEPFAEKALRIVLQASREGQVSPHLISNAFLGWGSCLHGQSIDGEEIQRRRAALFAEYDAERLWPDVVAVAVSESREGS